MSKSRAGYSTSPGKRRGARGNKKAISLQAQTYIRPGLRGESFLCFRTLSASDDEIYDPPDARNKDHKHAPQGLGLDGREFSIGNINDCPKSGNNGKYQYKKY